MRFNEHSDLNGKHAVLSPSKFTWIFKEDDELISMYQNSFAQVIGTVAHEFAMKRIKWRMSLRKTDSDAVEFYLLDHGIPEYAFDVRNIFPNLRSYVNDAIGYRMYPEVVLAPNQLKNCFGTTDAISYKDGLLRIHDLKTGSSKPSMDQLSAYAALFFMEYNHCKLEDSAIELRIYHPDELIVHEPDRLQIKDLMAKIVNADHLIENFKNGR